MKYQILQNTKGDKMAKENLDARVMGDLCPIHFLANYEIVADIEASDLDEVFEIGNIGPESQITRHQKMYSVSVGDVIRTDIGQCFVVKCIGFERLGA